MYYLRKEFLVGSLSTFSNDTTNNQVMNQSYNLNCYFFFGCVFFFLVVILDLYFFQDIVLQNPCAMFNAVVYRQNVYGDRKVSACNLKIYACFVIIMLY